MTRKSVIEIWVPLQAKRFSTWIYRFDQNILRQPLQPPFKFTLHLNLSLTNNYLQKWNYFGETTYVFIYIVLKWKLLWSWFSWSNVIKISYTKHCTLCNACYYSWEILQNTRNWGDFYHQIPTTNTQMHVHNQNNHETSRCTLKCIVPSVEHIKRVSSYVESKPLIITAKMKNTGNKNQIGKKPWVPFCA